MKLHIWFAAIILATICWLPTNAKAQYGGGTSGVNPNRRPDYYTNPRLTDTMIRNSLERRRREARLARNRGHNTHKKVMKKRAVRRKSRRVSTSALKQ